MKAYLYLSLEDSSNQGSQSMFSLSNKNRKNRIILKTQPYEEEIKLIQELSSNCQLIWSSLLVNIRNWLSGSSFQGIDRLAAWCLLIMNDKHTALMWGKYFRSEMAIQEALFECFKFHCGLVSNVVSWILYSLQLDNCTYKLAFYV